MQKWVWTTNLKRYYNGKNRNKGLPGGVGTDCNLPDGQQHKTSYYARFWKSFQRRSAEI